MEPQEWTRTHAQASIGFGLGIGLGFRSGSGKGKGQVPNLNGTTRMGASSGSYGGNSGAPRDPPPGIRVVEVETRLECAVPALQPQT